MEPVHSIEHKVLRNDGEGSIEFQEEGKILLNLSVSEALYKIN